jgi:hypothetical protein
MFPFIQLFICYVDIFYGLLQLYNFVQNKQLKRKVVILFIIF